MKILALFYHKKCSRTMFYHAAAFLELQSSRSMPVPKRWSMHRGKLCMQSSSILLLWDGLSADYFFDRVEQIVVGFKSRKFRILCFDRICAAEQESGFACLDHAEIIVTVTAGDRIIADRL